MIFNIIGDILTLVLDILLLPFRFLPSIWGLLFISMLAGFGMISIFRLTSNQEKISSLRKRMLGEVFGILLHVSSPVTVIRFAGRLIWSNTLYLLYILKPLAFIAIPFMLIWGQLDARYGTDTGKMNTPVTVTVRYEESLPERDDISLSGTGIEIIPPVVMVDTLREVSFRIILKDGIISVLNVNGTSTTVGETGIWNGAIILRGFNGENSLKCLFGPWVGRPVLENAGPISGWYTLQTVRYRVLGGHWSWLAVFLVFSSVSAIAGAKIFNVKI